MKKMEIDGESKSLRILMQASIDGELTILLLRTLIDAKDNGNDDNFFILVDGAECNHIETKTSENRTLTVPFPNDAEVIIIIGTNVTS